MSHAGAVNGAFATMGVLLLSTACTAHRRAAPDSPSRTALTASLGTLGVSFLVQSPAARDVQNTLLVNLGQLTGNGTTLIAAYAMQVMMLHILHGRPRATTLARRWLLLLLAALIALTGFFLATPTTADEFTSPDAPAGVVTYYLVYTGYLAVTLTAMVLLLRRYAVRVTDRWLRRSLHLYSWSCAAGMLYLVGRIGALVVSRADPDAVLTGDRYGGLEFLVAAVIPGLAMVLVLVAVLLRVTGRAADHRRAERRLRPLWEAVRAARPESVLPVSRRGAGLRLYRCVVEIQDAQLAAAQSLTAPVLARIDAAVADEGLSGDEAEVTRAAAVLAAGLAALRAGTPEQADPVSARPGNDEEDLAEVVRRLERVSAAFTGSGLVHRFAEG